MKTGSNSVLTANSSNTNVGRETRIMTGAKSSYLYLSLCLYIRIVQVAPTEVQVTLSWWRRGGGGL